ncbi:two-component response regulator ARR14 isoform X1 [Lathyrus oleraceus]|uniref:Two-component response regulator n=1 Tax=Pisum sativum TaxID=3888 RepID=A0A9D4XJW2_PEA|nr:two-component response regulator ARR14-like isoform X1 [Pisum sativum]XP_050873317.1 two-component response regulator ARR14-like isoform X1 [Pisum sativum]XP_050873318.1 two-component response regulator ARR14-like isoform X1 [Pisum sativum]XP_050873319.1 two-component response regulator ARR14-like isoform X1 [Pisum sativum]KAI5421542.1 hypothetical protein KIW84_045096 [Pisum sativum]
MESDKSQSLKRRKYNGPVGDVKVLVVDANSACRAIVSKMLLSLGYEVVTATLASDALSIIWDKKNEINLVLVEAQLPDMEIHEFMEKVKESANLPCFIMTAYDDDIPSITRALSTGAKLCFRKPVLTFDLQELWRFAVWNRIETIFSEEESSFGWRQSEMSTVNKGLESQSSMNAEEQSLQYANGKKIQESRDEDMTLLPKKRRRTWTDDLHRKFLDAVETAGINARPKVIFELMDVEGLTKESVANYLQKYRQSMKLRASAMAQHVNGYVSLTKKRGKGPLYFENQDVTNNPSILSNGMPQQVSDSSALYASLESSNYQDSPFEQKQLWPPLKQQRVVYNAEKQLDFRTLLAFDMNDQFYPALPIALLPPEKNEKIDEIFYSKQLFTDEDLNMWLSTIPDNVDAAAAFA